MFLVSEAEAKPKIPLLPSFQEDGGEHYCTRMKVTHMRKLQFAASVLMTGLFTNSVSAGTTGYSYIANLRESSLVDFNECNQALQRGRRVEVSATIAPDLTVQNAYLDGEKLFLVYFLIPEDNAASGMLCRAFYLDPQ